MVFNRGSKIDYDRWEELGNPGWGFNGLFPYFKKSEKFTPPDPDLADWKIAYNPASHGTKGFVQSSFSRFVWPSTSKISGFLDRRTAKSLLGNYIKSMLELKIPLLTDPAGGSAAGASWFTLSLDPKSQTRSTSEGFYTSKRPNLHLLAHNQVTKLQVKPKGRKTVATGVEYSAGENEKKYLVSASKDVILAAGALHTPQILQLSGIGDVRHLSSVGIKTVVDLPGVGGNYHDHLLLVTVQSCR
jgi:choline dehydrogenase-like flavoprotein